MLSTSKMKRFSKIVTAKSLKLFSQTSPILDIWQGCEYASGTNLQILQSSHEIYSNFQKQFADGLLQNNCQVRFTFSNSTKETLKKVRICSKLTLNTLEQRQWRRSGAFITKFKHISHFFLVFLLSTLSMYSFVGLV